MCNKEERSSRIHDQLIFIIPKRTKNLASRDQNRHFLRGRIFDIPRKTRENIAAPIPGAGCKVSFAKGREKIGKAKVEGKGEVEKNS